MCKKQHELHIKSYYPTGRISKRCMIFVFGLMLIEELASKMPGSLQIKKETGTAVALLFNISNIKNKFAEKEFNY